MPIEIVVAFKIIDIDKQQRKLGAVLFAYFNLIGQTVVEKAVVVKAGEAVGIGDVVEALDILVSLVDIISYRPGGNQKDTA
ncbi:hypothetical protein SDC9_54647 [bioreactor metagenome]|uniref:Uncharacterized protein n=1 Tax=bioreactor metagenome TaxID=1076179 RepID=A0A644WWN5_9ZZZZ